MLQPTTSPHNGYTLVEQLVVFIILAVLASIAIPFFLEQRRNAWAAAAHSDLQQAVLDVETVAYQHGSPDGLEPSHGDGRSLEVTVAGTGFATVRLSPGVRLALDCVDDPDRTCLCADHDNLGYTVAAYDSAAGGVRDPSQLDLDCIRAPNHGPVLVAPAVTDHFACDEQQRCRYGLRNAGDAGRLLFDGQEAVGNGSLLLDDANFGGRRSGGVGWAITYGTHDAAGQMRSGYTLQLDPGHRGGSFTIRSWGADGRHDWRYSPQTVRVPDFDFTAASDVEAKVEDGHLSLYVDGARYLHYEMGSQARDTAEIPADGGSFGIRTWGNDPELTFTNPRLELRD